MVVAAAAFAGGAYAATTQSGPSTREAFLSDVARRLHVSTQQLTAALRGAYQDQLQAAVKAGKLTQAEANTLERRLQQNPAAPLLPLLLGPVAPHLGGGRLLGLAGGLQAAEKYLGLSASQLKTRLAAGRSLALLATAEGKSASGLDQAIAAAVRSRLDRAVADKTITASQEEQILSKLPARIAAEVNATRPSFGAMRAAPHRLSAPPGAGAAMSSLSVPAA